MLSKILKGQSRLLITTLLIILLIMIKIFPQIATYLSYFTIILFVIWAFIIGEELVNKSRKYFEYSIYTYKLNLWLLISSLSIVLVIALVKDLWKTHEVSNNLFFILLPLAVIYLYSFAKVFYIISKSIVSLEINKEAGYSLVLGTFIQMLFFPVTSWFLLGRVQKLINNLE